ncbi:MAG TPA: adenylate/guanylate cyclase domain-containing protein [Caulobacteraceae bacterium]|nr:adenylate/guanylate cyclase domain-containing protein [Caulobacteraceae bacterium]
MANGPEQHRPTRRPRSAPADRGRAARGARARSASGKAELRSFLFTDIEGSSLLWLNHQAVMAEALARHDEAIREAVAHHGGEVFKTAGDAFFAVFRRPSDAVLAACRAQTAIAAHAWPGIGVLKARMAIHCGSAEQRSGDYFGPALNRCARLLTLCHGGQVLVTASVAELLASEREVTSTLRYVGDHPLDDPLQPVAVHQVLIKGLRQDFAAPRSLSKPQQERLLAVLAFDNLSRDPELKYFSDGVSEEIQQAVAKRTSLRVVARSSSFQFRGKDKTTRKVAAELKATHLLDGSVRRGGSRVRVAAQLVECASESTLWTDRFEGDLSDIFALQDRIAEAVATALNVALAPPATAAPLDPAVYEIFLRARSTIAEGSRLFDESAAEATPLLEQVVRASPDFAPAWGLLAYARAWTLRSGHRQGSYEEGKAGVVEAAATALRLDPMRVDAYLAQAMLAPWGAYREREELLNRALEAEHNEPAALAEMSTFCWSVGRFRDALGFAEQGCELNPLSPAARLQVAQMRAYVGDYEASIRMHQELRRRWPNNAPILMSLLNFALGLGFWDAYDEAIGEISAFEGWQGSDLHATQTLAETLRSGDPARAAERLRRYTALLDRTGTIPVNLLESLSYLGLVDDAYALAERASFAHVFDPDGPLPGAAFPGAMLGRWSPLNKTPRFVALCDRLGLCAYWRQSGRWPDCVEWTPYDFKAAVRRRASA